MDSRDSESSTDEDFPERLYGHLKSSAGAAGPATSAVHVQNMANANANDTSTMRSSITPSAFESARSSTSIFSVSSLSTISRPSTPPSSISTRSYQVPNSFAGTKSASSSRPAIPHDSSTSMLGDATLMAAEKDGDDPNMPSEEQSLRHDWHATPTVLTRLLAMSSIESPAASRTASYADGNPNLIGQESVAGATSLHNHLYSRGLLEGKHSDIAVIAFGHKYNLHRLILDRAPFFTTALTEPWLESKAKEVVLHPEEIDPTITRKAFELALKRLYGCDIRDEEDAEAVGLFATGSWLEMHDVVESAIESILRQMGPDTLSPLIKLVTNNYYGRGGDRILASAKAMLCRDGWEMALRYWDEIPGDIVREIIGGDGFYVLGEWDRWILAKRLLDRRLRQKAVEYGLATPGSRISVLQVPEVLSRQARRPSNGSHSRTASIDNTESHDVWTAIYTDPDIEPILVLMDHGIHYVHLDFERLQYIRQAKDVFGLSILPEHVITTALWQQMELRQRVVNAREHDLELGLSHTAEQPSVQVTHPGSNTSLPVFSPMQAPKGKEKTPSVEETTVKEESTATVVEMTAHPPKFWIPSADCNIVMGENAEPVITTNASSSFLRLASGMPPGIEATDVLWASHFAASTTPAAIDAINRPQDQPRTSLSGDDEVIQPRPVAYSDFPPFRFAAEFPNAKSLKEKKRVYSRTVFYAGSHWKIYIQKVRSQKNPQLGVYLHRAKERETEETEPHLTYRLPTTTTGSVDERIGLLEREMQFRSSDNRRFRRSMPTRHNDRGNNSEADNGSMAAYRRRTYGTGEQDTVLSTSYTAFDSGDSDSEDSPSSGDNGRNFFDEQTQSPSPSSGPSLTHFPPPQTATSNTTRPRSLPQTTTSRSHSFQTKRAPTLPSYTDARPTIKTYFKIYSPSKGGRLLSLYESAPDKFDFSQSWGWKSSTLMLDEGFSNPAAGMPSPNVDAVPNISVTEIRADDAANATSSLAAEVERDKQIEMDRRRKKEGALRFMVVIGNL